MKRFLKLICAFTLTVLLFGLASCGEDAGVPDGMQLVRGGEKYGYNFYVPEEWVASSYGEFASAYISAMNNSSVTFGEADMPDYGKDGAFDGEDAKKYFSENMDNLSYMSTRSLTVNGEKCTFGNEKNAYKFVYSYTYENADGSKISYRAMQILIARGERLYIFLYNSQNTVPSYSSDGVTYYDLYLEKVNEVISAFKFLDTHPTDTPASAGSSGEFVLVSEKSICGFDFYAPSDSREIASSALVHRDLGGGASVSISELVSNTQTTHPDDYFDGILANMEKSFGTVTKLTDTEGDKKDQNKLGIKGAAMAYCYEYSYSYAGVDYNGYMIIIQTGTVSLNAKAYIFNYTAKSADYAVDKSVLDEMINRLEF